MLDEEEQYGLTAFWYIHQNPLAAGLVKQMADWHYSSFRDFAGLRNGTLCDIILAEQLIGFDKAELVAEAYRPQVGTAGQTGQCI